RRMVSRTTISTPTQAVSVHRLPVAYRDAAIASRATVMSPRPAEPGIVDHEASSDASVVSEAKCWATCASWGSIASAIAARSIAAATARRTATSSNGGSARLKDANEKKTEPVVVWI